MPREKPVNDTPLPAPSDRYAWAVETARRLRAGESVDAVAVAEEIEQMGRSDAHELRSRITQILEHLLKLDIPGDALIRKNSRGWRGSIARQRIEIADLLEESPSLKARITPELLARCYQNAVSVVETEYGVRCPAKCRFTPEQVLGEALP
jgi:hypothetical protein